MEKNRIKLLIIVFSGIFFYSIQPLMAQSSSDLKINELLVLILQEEAKECARRRLEPGRAVRPNRIKNDAALKWSRGARTPG